MNYYAPIIDYINTNTIALLAYKRGILNVTIERKTRGVFVYVTIFECDEYEFFDYIFFD
jgi:hypothetical protein